MRDLYLPGWGEYLAMAGAGLTPWAPVTDRDAEARALAGGTEAPPGGFAEHFHEVPVMLVLLADLRLVAAVDRDLGRYPVVAGASIYPFAWNLLLAARAEGLGGVITTMNVHEEPAVKELLHVPADLVVAGVVVLGWPVQRPTRLRRQPVSSFATVDTFDGPPIGRGT
jgi:nitroreductase